MSDTPASLERFEFESSRLHVPTQDEVDPELLESKIVRARRLTAYNNLEERTRNRIIKQILKEIQPHRDKIQQVLGESFFTDLDQQLERFKLGEVNLYDLHKWVIREFLLDQEIDSEIIAIAFEVQREVFDLFKDLMNLQLPPDGTIITDKICNKFRNEEEPQEEDDSSLDSTSEREKFVASVQEFLTTTLDFLKPLSNIKGVGIVYNEPYTQEPREFIAGDIREDRIKRLVEDEALTPEDHDEAQQIIFGKKGDEENHLIIEMKFGARKIGYIDFIFEGKYVDPIMTKTCQAIKDRIDNFLDEGLQNVLEERIRREQLKILEKHFLDEWRAICIEFLKIIHSFSENPVLICKRFDLLTPGHSEITKDGEVGTQDDNGNQTKLSDVIAQKARQIKESKGKNVKVVTLQYPSFLDHEDLEKQGIDPVEAELMGAVIAEASSDTQRKMLINITKQLEDILKRREELRARFIQVFGLQVANAYLDGQLETMGEHEIVILIGDVKAYSKFTQAIAEAVKKQQFPENLVPEIMNMFTEEISVAIDRDTELKGVLDKIIGDEAIVFFGPPFDPEGRDIDGNKDGEQDIKNHILKGLKMCAKIQNIFRTILEKIEAKYGIKLPWYPLFSYGLKKVKDVVGIFGNIKNPYSRLDYTAFGTGINETARIQAAAPAGGVLVDYETWKIYEEKGGDEFVAVGLPFLVRGKNIKDPIPVIQIIPKEQLQNTKKKQEAFLITKKSERAEFRDEGDSDAPFFYCTEEDSELLPDGDYIVTGKDVEDTGSSILRLKFGDHHFAIKIDRDDIDKVEYPISIEMETELVEERKKNHFSRRKILRKKGDRFILIRHVSIEEIVEETLQKILDKNKKAGKDFVDIEDLPTGKYEIVKVEEQDDGDLVFTLLRGSKKLQLLLKEEENVLQGSVLKSGYLVHTQGICVCEPDELTS